MKILVTGAAGFIGSHLTRELAQFGSHTILGIDSISSYYSPSLKKRRLKELLPTSVQFQTVDISNRFDLNECVQRFQPDQIFHLAAQPGIRLSVDSHHMYVDANLTGFGNILNSALIAGVPSVVYASSSSVYGNVSAEKLSEDIKDICPTSFYGATKLSNEILARSYSSRYGLKTRGLRFFTVYGPWGRPDMAYFRVIAALRLQRKFTMYGDGSVKRDFTFVDDVIEITRKLGDELEGREEGFSDIVNVGGGSPVSIRQVIDLLSDYAETKLILDEVDSDPSDVAVTNADTKYLESLVGKRTFRTYQEGLRKSHDWSREMVELSDLDEWLN
jgi:UDP-glucuronate 4-epimerase